VTAAQESAVGTVNTSKWGVVLLAHGSQRGASKLECSCAWRETATPPWCQDCPSTPEGLRQAAQRLQSALGIDQGQMVLSCLEFIEPHPDQAVKLLSERGFNRVVVMPFLLGQGKHATVELHEILDEIRGQSPELQLHLAEGLGADPKLADLIVQQIKAVEGPTPPAHSSDRPSGILVVKAGTKSEYDDCQWLEELGALVEGQLGHGYAVAVAQSHYGDPTMDDAAAKLVESRRVSSILCVPYLFFPGMILRRNVLGGLDQIQQRYPDVSVAVTPPLGIDDRVVAVTADRVRRAWASTAVS
jgi:sirohydrochlorin ferrochelatase